MKKYTSSELKKILAAHTKWLQSKTHGCRANLSYSDLSDSNLSGSNLRGSDLSYSNLRGSDLSYSDLSDSNLSGSNLRGSDLSGSDLSGSNLRGSDLSYSNLRGSDLSYSDLSYSNYSDDTQWPAFFICPATGSFIAWKKLANDIVAELCIPEEAKRTSSLVGRKCRAEFAKVVALHGTNELEAVGTHDNTLVYRVGEIVRPDSYDDDIRVECTHGIHFFITRTEAEDYV